MKQLAFFAVAILCASPLAAQNTTVSATIPGYAGGSVTATFIPQGGGSPKYLYTGATINSVGTFTISAWDNQYSGYKPSVTRFNICVGATPATCYGTTVNVTGATEDISSAFSGAPQPPSGGGASTPATSNLLKGTGTANGVGAAIPGTDYASPMTINVKDYGATGNGTTNDTTAIQNAINAVHTAGGGEAFFPAGIYITSSPLLTYDNVLLQGTGAGTGTGVPGSVIKKTTNTVGTLGTVAFNGQSDNYNIDAILEVVHAANAYTYETGVRNLYLWGAGPSINAYGVFAPRTSRGVFEHLQIQNATFGWFTYNSWLTSLHNVSIDNTSIGVSWNDDGSGNATGDANSLDTVYVDDVVWNSTYGAQAFYFFAMNYSSLQNLAADDYNLAKQNISGINAVYGFIGCDGLVLSGVGAENTYGGVLFVLNSFLTISGVNTFETNQLASGSTVAVLNELNSTVTITGSQFSAISGTGNYHNIFLQTGSVLNSIGTMLPTGGSTVVGTAGTYTFNKIGAIGTGTVAVVTAGAGTGATATCTGTCTAQRGRVSIASAGVPAAGAVATVTFGTAYADTNYVCSVSMNGGATPFNAGWTPTSTTVLTLSTGVAISGTVELDYLCTP